MTDGTEKAAALIDIALSTYRDEILPGLPKEKRYAGAMIANALGVAQRRLIEPDPAAALLGQLESDADLIALARDIRAGRLSEETRAGLGRILLDYVTGELRITNPRFLERRQD